MIFWYWGAVSTLLPFLFRYDFISLDTRYLDVQLTKDFYFIFFVMLSLVCFGIGKIKSSTRAILISLSLMAIFTHSCYSVKANYQFIHYMAGIALLTQLISKWKAEHFEKTIILFKIICLSQCLSVIAQYSNMDFYKLAITQFIDSDAVKMQKEGQEIKAKKYDDKDPTIGTLGNPNHSAALIAVTSASLFSSPILLIPVLIALFMLKTAAAWASFGCAFMAFMYFKIKSDKNRFIFLIISAIIGMLAIYGVFHIGFLNDSGRFEVWEKTFRLLSWRTILLGNGLGHFADFFSRFYGLVHWHEFGHVHNEYIEALYAFGIAGCLLIVNLLLKVKDSKSIFACVMVGILSNCVFNFYFHISTLSLIGIITYVTLYVEQQGD